MLAFARVERIPHSDGPLFRVLVETDEKKNGEMRLYNSETLKFTYLSKDINTTLKGGELSDLREYLREHSRDVVIPSLNLHINPDKLEAALKLLLPYALVYVSDNFGLRFNEVMVVGSKFGAICSADDEEFAKKLAASTATISERYRKRLTELDEEYSHKISSAVNSGFIDMFKTVQELITSGWELNSSLSGLDKGRLYLHYKGEIVPTHVHVDLSCITHRPVDREYYITVPLPEKYSSQMKIKQLAIPVNKSKVLSSAYGKGKHPHLNSGGDGGGWCSVCIGDNKGKDLVHIVELIENLKTVNYMSLFGGASSSLVHEYIRELDETYKKTGKVIGLNMKNVASGGTLFHVGSEFSAVEGEIGDIVEEEGTW